MSYPHPLATVALSERVHASTMGLLLVFNGVRAHRGVSDATGKKTSGGDENSCQENHR